MARSDVAVTAAVVAHDLKVAKGDAGSQPPEKDEKVGHEAQTTRHASFSGSAKSSPSHWNRLVRRLIGTAQSSWLGSLALAHESLMTSSVVLLHPTGLCLWP